MLLYTFTKKDSCDIIEQVRANNHDEAVEKASGSGIDYSTDFYSETLSDREQSRQNQ